MIYFLQVFHRKWLVKQLVFLSLKSLEVREESLSKIQKCLDTAMLFKNSTTVLEPNTAVCSGIGWLLSLTKSIGAEPCRDECVLHRLNLENSQPKFLRSSHLPEPSSQVMLCGWTSVCSQCLWFQCVPRSALRDTIPFLVLSEGLGWAFTSLCWFCCSWKSAYILSLKSRWQYHLWGPPELLKPREQVLELFCENICVFSVMCMWWTWAGVYIHVLVMFGRSLIVER